MHFTPVLRCAIFVLVAGTTAQAIAGERPTSTSQDASTTSTADSTPMSASTELSAPPPRPTRAVGRLVCTGKTFKISTGTGNGSCVSGASEGECKDGGNSASATCKDGCGPTTGKGTCTTE